MQLIIESPHVSVDDTLQKQIEESFEHIGKMYSRILKCVVVLKKEPSSNEKQFEIEANLFIPGYTLFAQDKAETFELALHEVADEITRQLHRHVDKREEN